MLRSYSAQSNKPISSSHLRKRKVSSRCNQVRRVLSKESLTHTLFSQRNLTLNFSISQERCTTIAKIWATKQLCQTKWLWICTTRTGQSTCTKLSTAFGCKSFAELFNNMESTHLNSCNSHVNFSKTLLKSFNLLEKSRLCTNGCLRPVVTVY